MNGQSVNNAACPAELTDQQRFGPNRSTSLPAGHAAMKLAAPAQVRPSPTWAAVSPTIWVKKTADPVMKVPSPRAKSSDWVASRPASGEGGRILRPSEANIVFDPVSQVRQPSLHLARARQSAAAPGGRQLCLPPGPSGALRQTLRTFC